MFEEGYFIVSKKYLQENENPSEHDLVIEANRIIEENLFDGKMHKRNGIRKVIGSFKKTLKLTIVPFLLGALSALLTAFIVLNI